MVSEALQWGYVKREYRLKVSTGFWAKCF